MSVMTDLQMLFNQQLSEYREIKDLREKLREAETRHQGLADEIQRRLNNTCDCPPDCQGPDNSGNKRCRAECPLSGDDTAISLTPAGTAPASDDTQVAGCGFSGDEDLGYDPPDWLPQNERRAYADSVGMPLHEKIR